MLHSAAETLSRYSRGEQAADAVIHILGLAAALTACIILALAARRPVDAGLAMSLGLYAAGLTAMLGCSALYNLTGEGPRKALLRRFDHAAIFVMIAGTYTAIAALGIGGTWGTALLAFVWTGAAGGVALKLLAPARFERASILAYLLLGWAGLAALGPLIAALPALDLGLIFAGGLLYSFGVIVHLSTRLRYHNAVWHALVLAAAACHYAVVLRLAAG
ncbi:PAQR family membrane homeostasis protein TrhA [Plastoroseomonas hellenica]|uniref:Hemolysin III family protein n=1 Tax=Plastoroseomonas hellenica TaxID=2687306 RepID=A0ABS5F481_9PROT|nr:hemolysin III family protein [Plastoroseomonas hellenica]MBR0644120.1 hemolysin III family protein [Plastoroseomonas hellenica]MBR0667401.1 hemolysin III family protein [Plastoroseomonas hellenica]